MNLGPTIRNSTFKDVKIITGDDQRLTLPYWANVVIHVNSLTVYTRGSQPFADQGPFADQSPAGKISC